MKAGGSFELLVVVNTCGTAQAVVRPAGVAMSFPASSITLGVGKKR